MKNISTLFKKSVEGILSLSVDTDPWGGVVLLQDRQWYTTFEKQQQEEQPTCYALIAEFILLGESSYVSSMQVLGFQTS